MKYLVLISLCLLLLSCGSSSLYEFSLKIKLIDAEQNPLSGYRIGISTPAIQNSDKSRFETSIPFRVVQPCLVNIEVQDYFGKHIETLCNDSLATGNHCIVWSMFGEEAREISDGIYRIKAEYFVDNQSIFCDYAYCYKLCWRNTEASPYITNENGEVTIDDILPFPGFYCTEEVPITDEQSCDLGAIMDFGVGYQIIVSETDSTGNSTGEYRDVMLRLQNTANSVTLVWDDLKSSGIETKRHSSNSHNTQSDMKKDTADRTPFMENKIGPVYPNPFD
jgi:flagellar hook assembly protein FlgD